MRGQAGMTLVELLAVLAIVGIGVGVAALYLRPMEAPLDTATAHFDGTLRAARLKAMATTSAYRLQAGAEDRVVAAFADSCSAGSWTPDPQLELTLPRDVTMNPTNWTICFGSRGLADGNVVVGFVHPEYGSRSVEVMLGGTSRVLP
jgi:prepilin-type N-terminal cleavage/methylation domain-containing protein